MIKIFDQEKQDGLEEVLLKNQSINYVIELKPSKLDIDDTLKLKLSKASANPSQFDLFYFESILASVGWNKNDDVFEASELWKARSTAVDKPINFMHNQNEIIGHMTSYRIIANDKLIDDSSNNMPEIFDIVTGGVLYKFWEDKTKAECMQKLISEITESLWCVSLECVYPHFDYAVITPDGLHKTIARTEESSFLTKYLRGFGGEGVYQGHKIGRALRNLSFSAEGIVTKPANPRSIITSYSNKEEVSAFHGTAASIKELNKNQEIIMYTQEQYDKLVADLNTAKAEYNVSAETNKILTSKATELENANKALSTEVNMHKDVIKAKDDAVAALNSEITSLKAELNEAKSKIEAARLEVVKSARLQALLARNVASEKAQELVNKYVTVADEVFDGLISAFPLVEAAKKEDDKEEEKEEMKAKCSELEKAAAQSSGPTLAVPPVVDNTQVILSKASEWIGKSILNSKKGE